jgi:hypothetical protein
MLTSHVWKKALLGSNPANGSCASTPLDLQLDSRLVRVKSPASPTRAPGPGAWNLLDKSLFMKSKTCIIGSIQEAS